MDLGAIVTNRSCTRSCSRTNACECWSIIPDMRLGVFDHLGWAVAVTASADYEVVDRRRIELIEPGFTPAPIHYESHRLDVAETVALLEAVEAAVVRQTRASLAELEDTLPGRIDSISLRRWPTDFPQDIEIRRCPPYESRADPIMYREILADIAESLGWDVHFYDAKTVTEEATARLGDRVEDVLYGPTDFLGPPWTKEHRLALAATIVAV